MAFVFVQTNAGFMKYSHLNEDFIFFLFFPRITLILLL